MSLPSSRLARRAGGLTALSLGALTLGMPATALAAPADEAPAPDATTLPEAGSAATELLTPTPDVAATMTPEPVGAHFGWGKLDPDVVFAEGSSFPSGAELDRTGAQIRVTFQSILGTDTTDVVNYPDGPPSLECTWDETDADDNGNLCDFPADGPVDGGRLVLMPMSAFTIELVTAPTSGQVLLPLAEDRVIAGYTDGNDAGDLSAVFEAPGAYRSIGVTLTGPGGAAIAGATFDLCTVPGGTCDPAVAPSAPTTSSGLAGAASGAVLGGPVVSATSTSAGQLLFPGLYLPGTYQLRQTASADGSPFSTAPLLLTLSAATSTADTTTPTLLPVRIGAPIAGVTAPAPVPAAAAAAVTTTAPARAAGELASTGAEPLPVLAIGAGLVLAGGAVTVAATRRRTR